MGKQNWDQIWTPTGTKCGNETGTKCGNETGTQCGNETGTKCGNETGTKCGNETGTKCGNETGTKCGNETGTKCGNETGTKYELGPFTLPYISYLLFEFSPNLMKIRMSIQENWDRTGALSANDPNSFSNPECIRPQSMELKWEVDFEHKLLKGSVRYDLIRDDPSVSILVLDTQELEIKSIKSLDGSELSYVTGPEVATFGNPLEINLPKTPWSNLSICIEYETTSKSTCLQWLSKEQTAGKQFPYLFSKCSPIQARALLPCQDTPSVKTTYTAEVLAPSSLTVLMGAVRQESDDDDAVQGHRRHYFVQKIPIPSYLIALVVGKLESKRIGPRTSVWAESGILESAAYEFEDTEKMLAAEEGFLGEYVWGTYDLLVLPPSFPSGGMENPCLTFIAPTVIAGDKSLTNVLAHEIAHSWTGNLVTNKSFEHFWLNEGLTVYVERRVLGILEGESFRHFLAIGGLKALKGTINALGHGNPMTALVPNLTGVNPMHSFSLVPYEKGFLFLYYLEQIVGGIAPFEIFLKEFIWKNAYKSVDTNRFREMFVSHFTKKTGKESVIGQIDWNAWLYAPGLPSFDPQYDQSLADVCTALKTRWISWNPDHEPCPFYASDLDAFTLRSHQILEFLAQLNEKEGPLGIEKIEALDSVYQLSKVQNSEIKFLWITICIKSQSKDIIPLALDFITQQGRMKFVRPIYKALYDWEEMRPLTIETFRKNRPNLMPNSAHLIASDLKSS